MNPIGRHCVQSSWGNWPYRFPSFPHSNQFFNLPFQFQNQNPQFPNQSGFMVLDSSGRAHSIIPYAVPVMVTGPLTVTPMGREMAIPKSKMVRFKLPSNEQDLICMGKKLQRMNVMKRQLDSSAPAKKMRPYKRRMQTIYGKQLKRLRRDHWKCWRKARWTRILRYGFDKNEEEVKHRKQSIRRRLELRGIKRPCPTVCGLYSCPKPNRVRYDDVPRRWPRRRRISGYSTDHSQHLDRSRTPILSLRDSDYSS